MISNDQLVSLVLANLEDEKHFLVHTVIKGIEGGTKKILVLIDGDEGITIESCAKLSRKLGQILEEQNLMEEAYILEVSSPGLEHPLSSERQYKKNIGRNLKVQLNDGEQINGKLIEVAADHIVLEEEIKGKGKKTTTALKSLPFENIKKSNVLVSFK